MPFCRQCGTSIETDVQFCPNCGTPAAAPTVAIPTPSAPPVYTAPVYAPPVYTPPVYAAPIAPIKKAEPRRLLNIAAIIILGLCLMIWLFVPYISTTYTTRETVYDYYYDYYWDTWDYDYSYETRYHYYEGSAGRMVIDLIDGYGVDEILDDGGVLALTPLFTFIFISLGILFTFLKKMPAVRAMGIASTATLGAFAFIQLIISGDLLGAHAGFWLLLGGSIVLIACSGQRYAKDETV